MTATNTPSSASVGRRRFLIGMLAGTGGLVVYGAIRGSSKEKLPPQPSDIEGAFRPNVYLTVTPDDRILFAFYKTELGQGTMTGFAMLVAEELEVPLEKLEIFQADGSKTYSTLNGQSTGGSRNIMSGFVPLRQIAAATRMMLIAAAAQKWEVAADSLRAEAGRIVDDANSRSLAYGELVVLAQEQAVPPHPQVKERSAFKLLGTPARRVDSEVKITGRAQFGIDVQVPNMARAVMIHPPRLGATVRSVQSTKARGMLGVVDVVETPRGVGVVAEKYWQALRAASAVRVEWTNNAEQGSFSTETMRRELAQADTSRSRKVRDDGNVDAAFANHLEVAAAYEAPFLSHSPMEPMNATVHVTDSGCEVWTGHQGPVLIQEALAKTFGLERTDILVHSLYSGGSFGRRSHPDVTLEAAFLSKAVGRPVQVIWSRENDTRAGFYRPASYTRMRGALDKSGALVALSYDSQSQSILGDTDLSAVLPDALPPRMRDWLMRNASRLVASNALLADVMATEGASKHGYAIENQRVAYTPFDTPLQTSWWRSVGHSFNGFVIESFMDELAHAAKQDPYSFRRGLLASSPRWLGVLDAVAELSDWGKAPLPEGTGRGIAVNEAFGSFVAQVMDVRLVEGQIKVDKVYCAFDCGYAVNPDLVVSQVQGSIIFGLSAALWGEITVVDGAVQQGNFDTYRLMRMHESPSMEIRLLEGPHEPGGVGEPAVAPVAGALANALFDLTGVRIRRMPMQMMWDERTAHKQG